MSKSVKDLKYDKLYKDTSILFDDYPILDGKADKRNGRLITCLTSDIEEMMDIIDSDTLLYKLTHSFYSDKSFKLKLPNDRKENVLQSAYQKEMFKIALKSRKIRETHNTPEAYKGTNVFYFLGSKLNFFKKGGMIFDGELPRAKQLQWTKDYFKNNITNFSFYKAYNVVDIYIPVTSENKVINDLNEMNDRIRFDDLNHLVFGVLISEGYDGLKNLLLGGDSNAKLNLYLSAGDEDNRYLYKIPSSAKELSINKLLKFNNQMVSNAYLFDDIEDNIEDPLTIKDKIDPAALALITEKVGKDTAKDYVNGIASKTIAKMADSIVVEVSDVREASGTTKDTSAKTTRKVVEKARPKADKVTNKSLKKAKTKDVSISRRDKATMEHAQSVKLERTNTEFYDIKRKEYGDGTLKRNKTHDKAYDESLAYDTVARFDAAAYYVNYFDMLREALLVWGRDDKMVPLYLQSMVMTDTSDAITKKADLVAKFIDKNLKPHSIRVAIPEIIEYNRLFIGGNWKIVSKQILLDPLVKTDRNEVQIISNQNKCFLTRSGDATSITLDIIKHYFMNPDKYPSVKSLNVKTGKSGGVNEKYYLHIDYDNLSRYFYKFKSKEFTVIFNQQEIRDRVVDKTSKMDLTRKTVVAIDNVTGDPIIADEDGIITYKDGKYKIGEFLLEIVIGSSKSRYDDIISIKPTRKLAYTQMTLLSRKMPLIVVLGYLFGLWDTLDKAGIKYTLEDKKVTPKNLKELTQYKYIRFKDTNLRYEADTTTNELLMNGLQSFNTKDYNFSDLNTPDVYLEIFEQFGKGSSRITKGILGFKEVFFDNIVLRRLDKQGIPDNLLDMSLMGNKMLGDTHYIRFVSTKNKRIRPAIENIIVALYKSISEEYLKFVRLSFTKEIPKSISVPYNAVLRHLGENPLIENFDKVNPIKELEARHVVSFKGPGGLNVAEGYSKDKRTFDESMLGTMSVVGSQGTIGINRILTADPPILNADGDLGEVDVSSLKTGNLLSPAEAATPLVVHDDGKRRVFTQNQFVQFIPNNHHVKEAPIITGYESTIPNIIGNDFIKRAKLDGVVTKVDEKAFLITVKYKSPPGITKALTDVFSYRDVIIKHGGAGIHLPNNLTAKVKMGDRFKKNDIIVANSTFFYGDKENTKFTIGTMTKLILNASSRTNDDGTNVRRGFGKDTVPPEEMGKDMKKITKDYIKKVSTRNKTILEEGGGSTHPELEYVGITEPRDGMIHGQNVDVGDVLIEISNEFNDLYKVGDKMSMWSCIKSVSGCSTPDELMPYSDFRPDEPIDVEANYSDLENRLAKGPALALYINKVLVELKRQIVPLTTGKISPATRKKIQKMIIDCMHTLEPGGYNKKKYTEQFKSQSDTAFSAWVKAKANDQYRYFQITISSYDDDGFPTFDNIKKAAKLINIPLDEYVWFKHMKFKDENGKPIFVKSKTKMPVGYTLVRTPVQRVLKKSKQSMDTSNRDALTGQQTKKTKGGRMSFVDMGVATALGQENLIREVSMVRSDNMNGKMQGEEQIRETGTLILKNIKDYDGSESVALNTADKYLLAGFIKSNLITDSYKMKGMIKESFDKGRVQGSDLKSEDDLRREKDNKRRVKSSKEL